jgi:hypothetical protein
MHRLKFGHRDGDRPEKRISFSGVVATLALVLALGGGSALAASHYLITSTSQIKPSVRHALRGERGYIGYRGYRGYTGATGASGSGGATSVTEQIATGQIAASSSGSGTVTCPAGTKATGGGGFDGGVATAVMYQDGPLPNSGTAATPTGWSVSWKTNSDAITWSVYATCVSP